MTLQEITTKMQEGASKKSAFGNSVKFATDQGVVPYRRQPDPAGRQQ